VGHTHEDIDAMFHQIADDLRRKDAETLPELTRMLPGPTEIKGGFFDIRGWLEPSLAAIKHHTKPLHYRFVQTRDSKICLYYKGTQKALWKDLGCSLFKQDHNNQVSLPKGRPDKLLPDFSSLEPEAVLKQVVSLTYMFCEPSTVDWWKAYCNKIIDLKGNQNAVKEYASSGTKWLLPTLPKARGYDEEDDDEPPAIPEQLQNMLDAEVLEPEV